MRTTGDDVKVPLAEHFHSVQGEGHWAGTPMHFFRFPGCNVGRDAPNAPRLGSPLQVFGLPEAKQCRSWDGRHFWCDTDYAQHFELDLDFLLADTFEHHACFTGGEPLLHQMKPWFKLLYDGLRRRGVQIHIETSGTRLFYLDFDWVTVSPKANYDSRPLQKANQIKLLVDRDFSLAEAEALTKLVPDAYVYLSPIFDPNDLVKENVDRCLELLRVHPEWRLSVQWHKWIGVR